MKQAYSISVRGRSGITYSFNFKADARYVEGWISEGLDISGPIVGWCPLWVQQLGLAKPWFWLQERCYDMRDAIFFWRKYTR